MKLRKLLKWLLCVILALLSMSMFTDDEDKLFSCIYNQFCNKHSFEFVRGCWLILSTGSKAVIQQCTSSTCKIQLPEFYSSEDLCSNNVSYDKKRECFYVCFQKFTDYIKNLQKDRLFSYSTVYQNLVNAQDCITPFIDICTPT